MADLFISYSRHDQAFVRELADRLMEHGKEVWVDWEGIPPTAEFMAEIHAGIESSDAFAFVISPDSARSSVCRAEVAHAEEVSKRIVPIHHREPDGVALPEAVASRNWIFLPSPPTPDAVAALVEVLDRDLDDVRRHTRWLGKALEWDRHLRERSLLLRGTELGEAEAWLAAAAGRDPRPTPLHYEFVQASRGAAAKRQRLVVAILIAGMASALALAAFALIQRSRAVAERKTAESRLVASEALTQLGMRVDVGARLALTALRVDRTPQARDSVLAAVRRSGSVLGALAPGGTVTAVSFAPRSRLVAAGTNDGGLMVWNTPTLRVAAQLRVGTARIHSIAFSVHGDLMAAADDAGQVRLWHLGAPPVRVRTPPLRANAVAFAPNGSLVLATAGGVAVWHSGDRAPKLLLAVPYPLTHVAVSARGAIAAGGDAGAVLVPPGGRPLHVGREQPVQDLAFSPDGASLGYVQAQQALLVDVRRPNHSRRLERRGATSIAFGLHRLVAVGALDGRIGLWQDRTRGPAVALRFGDAAVTAVAFGPRGILGSASAGTIILSATAGSPLEHSETLGLSALDDLAAAGDARIVAGGEGSLLAIEPGTPPRKLQDPPRGAISVGASGDGRVVAAGGLASQQVVVWTRGIRRGSLTWRDDRPVDVAVSPDGTTVAVATQRGTLDLWRSSGGGSRPSVVPVRKTPLTAVAAAPSSAFFVTGAADGSVSLVARSSREPKLLAQLGRTPIAALAVAPNGRQVAVATGGGRVLLVAIGSGGVSPLPGSSRTSLTSVAFDPAETTIAAGDDAGHLYLWSTRDRRSLGQPLTFDGRVVAVAFESSGRRLAVGLQGGAVVLVGRAVWDDSAAVRFLCARFTAPLAVRDRIAFLPADAPRDVCG